MGSIVFTPKASWYRMKLNGEMFLKQFAHGIYWHLNNVIVLSLTSAYHLLRVLSQELNGAPCSRQVQIPWLGLPAQGRKAGWQPFPTWCTWCWCYGSLCYLFTNPDKGVVGDCALAHVRGLTDCTPSLCLCACVCFFLQHLLRSWWLEHFINKMQLKFKVTLSALPFYLNTRR